MLLLMKMIYHADPRPKRKNTLKFNDNEKSLDSVNY